MKNKTLKAICLLTIAAFIQSPANATIDLSSSIAQSGKAQKNFNDPMLEKVEKLKSQIHMLPNAENQELVIKQSSIYIRELEELIKKTICETDEFKEKSANNACEVFLINIELGKLKTQHVQQIDNLRQIQEAKIKNLNEKHKKEEQKYEKEKAENSRLSDVITLWCNKLKNTEQKLQESDEGNKKLNFQVEQMEKAILESNDKQKINEELNKQIEALKQELISKEQAYYQQLQELNTQLSLKKETDMQGLNGQINVLQKKLNGKDSEIIELNKQIREFQIKEQAHDQQLQTLNAQLSSQSNNDLQNLKEKTEELQKKIKSKDEEITKLNTQINDYQIKKQPLPVDQNKEIRTENQESVDSIHIESLEQQVSLYQKQNKELQEKNNELQKTINSFQDKKKLNFTLAQQEEDNKNEAALNDKDKLIKHLKANVKDLKKSQNQHQNKQGGKKK